MAGTSPAMTASRRIGRHLRDLVLGKRVRAVLVGALAFFFASEGSAGKMRLHAV
jgi:hypothetical protein